MLMRALIFAATLLLLGGLTRAQLGGGGFAKNGCSIQFPQNWKIDSPAGTTAFVFATCPEADTANGQQQAATLIIARIAVAKPDLMALAKKYQAGDFQNKNYKPAEAPAEIKINGAPAVCFGGTYTLNGKPLRNRVWLIAQGGNDSRVYIVTFTALAAASDMRLPIADASVATFKIFDEKR
jgi:hypothetical protein